MNKKFSLFLVITLFAVQVFSLLHMAEHGFKEHKHNGVVCSVYLYGEQTKGLDLATAPIILEPDYISFRFNNYEIINNRTIDVDSASARAPPTFDVATVFQTVI